MKFFKNATAVIEPLNPKDYHKCSNIWNMKTQPLTDKWLEEIKSGNRLVFIYKINGEFIGEGALVIIFFLDDKLRLDLQDFAAVVIINLLVSLFVVLFLPTLGGPYLGQTRQTHQPDPPD